MGNDILVINCYDHEQIHQVQIGKKEEKMTIVDTYITDTNDLFIATQVKVQQVIKYKIFHIDLDKSNVRENKKRDEHFRIEEIFEYSEKHVDKRALLAIHVRGSSRKEKSDINQMRVIFFLHQGKDQNKIYFWIDNKDDDKKPLFLSDTVSNKFYVHDPNAFFFLDKKFSGEGEQKELKSQEIKKVEV